MYIPDHNDDYGDWNMYTVSDPAHPEEVWDLIKKGQLSLQKSEKIVHKYRQNGAICSLGKDPALFVTRSNDSVFYYCHRCKESGRIYNEHLAPADMTKLLSWDKVKDLVNPDAVNKKQGHLTGTLPKDGVLTSDLDTNHPAVEYLRKYGVYRHLQDRYQIQWSDHWNRLIFPIYQHVRIPSSIIGDSKLVGWTGRCIKDLTKKERQEQRTPKWITKKLTKDDGRIYFHAYQVTSYIPTNPVIIVEDAVSALKVNRVMNFDTYALLNTYVQYDLVSRLRAAPIVLWLDNDALSTAVKSVIRYTSLGFKMARVKSIQDPKDYNTENIRTKINDAVMRAAKSQL